MKSLLKGIGSSRDIKKYYDVWSTTYDNSLLEWNYQAPRKATLFLKKYTKIRPKYLLDLACGTGLFVQEFKKIYPDCTCDGSDISKKIINISQKKGLFRNLYQSSFEKEIRLNNLYNIVSLIGGMTYCTNYHLLFSLVYKYLEKKGYFIFTHRVDIWEKYNFDKFLNLNKKNFETVYKSRPINYLPKNKDFGTKVKIRIVLLNKK